MNGFDAELCEVSREVQCNQCLEAWLPFVSNYRTFLNNPNVDHAALFGGLSVYK